MKRLSKQANYLLNYSQLVIALFFVFDAVIGAKVSDVQQSDPNNDQSRPLSSILSNYHSDAEQILRSPNNFENKSNPSQTQVQLQQPGPFIPSNKAKYEEQLKIVKRSPRNYNFGLGKRNSLNVDDDQKPTVELDDKQEQILEGQVRKLLNYLYNIDINLIWNYLSNMNEEDLKQPALSRETFKKELIDELRDAELAQAEKYKEKRDTKQRQYAFGLGKRERQYSFGIGKRFNTGYGMGNPRLDEYIKRRYSFGIGKRSA